jgi:hypothetical protein
MIFFRILFHIVMAAVLTLFTQIGGIVYLLSLTTYGVTNKWANKGLKRSMLRFSSFLLLYSIFTFLIVPPIAKKFGRVPLPIIAKNNVEPLNIVTCLANRHYVRPALRDLCYEAGQNLNEKYPGAAIKYMDANFPFINNYPLLPHISHHDGKKLDIAFCYTDNKTGKLSTAYPPHIGYGVSELPRKGEYNKSSECDNKNKMYSLMYAFMPQGDTERFTLDEASTRYMIGLFIKNQKITKILIEPHLKTRLKLSSQKVRFHGCKSVRHDDHIHIQI